MEDSGATLELQYHRKILAQKASLGFDLVLLICYLCSSIKYLISSLPRTGALETLKSVQTNLELSVSLHGIVLDGRRQRAPAMDQSQLLGDH